MYPKTVADVCGGAKADEKVVWMYARERGSAAEVSSLKYSGGKLHLLHWVAAGSGLAGIGFLVGSKICDSRRDLGKERAFARKVNVCMCEWRWSSQRGHHSI